jgi:hypothetical protein
MLTNHDVEQGTPEWHALRDGLITASNAGKLLQLGIESALATSNFKGNWYTQRGHDLEPEAIELYELVKNITVERPGFITNSKYPGCGVSPDGITDRLIEVKCFMKDKHLSINEKTIPFEVIAQIQFGMMITGLRKTDLVLYNPDLEAEEALKIITVDRDLKIHERFLLILKENRRDKVKLIVWKVVGYKTANLGANAGNEYLRVAMKSIGEGDPNTYYLNLPKNYQRFNEWLPYMKEGNVLEVNLQSNGKNVNFYMPFNVIKQVKEEADGN